MKRLLLLSPDIGAFRTLKTTLENKLSSNSNRKMSKYHECNANQSLKNDLPGVYVLTALFSDELWLTESELSVLRERGIPLTLTIRDDGAVSLLIFDMQTELRADFDAMFFLADGHPYPFFFQNGSLTVWDSGSRAVFEKII